MATVNTIEQRILQMEGGEFQKLCDAYLSAIGYGRPNSFGSIAGTNKVKKGTPDTFFERTNGKLVFAEYTTQKDDLFGKLRGDLGKCFNEKKTKVPVSKLEEIVICYTSQLEPSQVLSLRSKCEKKGVKLTLLGISALANDLLNHSLLVRNSLNLAIDTGQVIPLESFPAVYGKSKFATKLDTKFHFREKEIEDFLNALESYDLVVISGKAGVGKSRFALEGCRNFANKHPEYQAYAIVSLSQNLYDDLKERFSLPGQFLILVDDANRVNQFSYFMYILWNQKDNQHIKIVVTVRDYALDKIENDISNCPNQSIQLDPFTNDQIKEFAKDEFGILNTLYLERIIDISGGNPRIAAMISKVAVETNNLQSINDVSTLYDEYFSSIKEDLQNLGEPSLLKTAGIIAFLRAVDRTNEQMMIGIQESFCISPNVFWDCAFRLHDLEMVDMYEDEVVRISDQVLSTYLFYLAFFKEKVLDFSDILQNYFPGFRGRIKDSLNPVLNAFDQEAIFDLIRPKVKKLWEIYTSLHEEENLLALAESFWHLLPTETLFLIQTHLSPSQSAQVDFSQLEGLDSNKLNNVRLSIELQLLGKFRYATPDLRNVALDLLFDYLDSRQANILQVLHILVDDYGFDRFSNQDDFSIQQLIVDLIADRTENGQNELYSRLFISIGGEYLKTHFETHEMRSEMTMTIYNFTLQPSPSVFHLRATIFDRLFILYKIYQKHVITVLENYINGYHPGTSNEVFSFDAVQIIGFIQTDLIPQNYGHNVFVNDYLDFLENHKVTYDSKLRKKFQNDTYLVYRLLKENRKDFIQCEYEEYQRIRKKRFKSYFAKLPNADIKKFIDQCIEIVNEAKQNHDRYEIISGFDIGMGVLAETRQDLFEIALCHYLQEGDQLDLNPLPLIQIYIKIYGKDKTLALLNRFDFPNKRRWLFGYYQRVPPVQADENDLFALYKLFEESELSQLPNHLDFLVDYTRFDHRVVAKIAQLILDKGDLYHYAWILNSITNPYSEINKHLINCNCSAYLTENQYMWSW